MAAGDYFLRLKDVPWSYTAHAEWHAVLKHFTCSLRQPNVRTARAFSRMVQRRRRWLEAMRAAGWDKLDGIAMRFARNCPPCGVRLAQRKMRYCRLAQCAFCHGRKVSKAFAELRKRAPRLAGLRIASVMQTYADDSEDCQFEYSRGVPVDTVKLQKLLRKHATIRADTRKRLFAQHVVAGYTWQAIVPHITTATKTQLCGYWSVRHAVVALVEPEWTCEDASVIVQPATLRQLAKQLGVAFSYPIEWQQHDALRAELLVQLFDYVGGQRFITRIGPR